MNELDNFGRLIVDSIRDKALLHLSELKEGKLRTPSVQDLQESIRQLSEAEKNTLTRTVTRILDVCLHDFLNTVQQTHDLNEGLEVFMNGTSVAEESGMLNGEIYGEDGWIARFSKHPICEDINQ